MVIPVVGEDIKSRKSQNFFISTDMIFKLEGSIHDMTVVHTAQSEIVVHQPGD